MAISAYPFDCWMGLASGATEVSGVDYVRRPATFEDIGDGIGANVASVQWPACGSDWGLIDTVNLYDALGSAICSMPTTAAVHAGMYDELRVSAGSFTITILAGILEPGGLVATAYDVGAYGVGPYEFMPVSTLLFRSFGTVALCGNQPGDWTPTPPCETGVWTPAGACQAGAWAPGPFDVVPLS